MARVYGEVKNKFAYCIHTMYRVKSYDMYRIIPTSEIFYRQTGEENVFNSNISETSPGFQKFPNLA